MGRRPLAIDELDLKIVRALLTRGHGPLQGVRVAASEVADALSVHRNTVIKRVRRLTERGAFLPPVLSVDPSAVGQVGGQLELLTPPHRRTSAVRDALFEVEGVAAVWELLDGWEVVVHAPNAEALDRKAERLRELAEGIEMKWTTHTRDYPPRPIVPLSQLDVALLRELLPDARRPFGEIARKLGRTVRTIERRYSRLEKEGVVYLVPNDFEALQGLALAFVTAGLPPQAARRKRAVAMFLATFANAFVANTEGRRAAHALIFAPTLRDVDRQARDASAALGPIRVRVVLGQWFNPKVTTYLAGSLRPSPAGSRAARSR